MMIYTLTHEKEKENGEYDHIPVGEFSLRQLVTKIKRLDDMAYQYYVTEWDDEEIIAQQTNADEFLEDWPMIEVGDIVLNPKQRGLCCVVSAIEHRNERGYFVLCPFTKHGWPSRDKRKWQYWHISLLSTLEQQKKGGYNRLIVCPECSKKGYSLFQAPLRKESIYNDNYKCQLCKKDYELREKD